MQIAEERLRLSKEVEIFYFNRRCDKILKNQHILHLHDPKKSLLNKRRIDKGKK